MTSQQAEALIKEVQDLRKELQQYYWAIMPVLMQMLPKLGVKGKVGETAK